MILIGFLFYRFHGVSGRPGYRIDGVLSRGALKVSNLIAFVWRAQTFAYLAYHLSWFLFGSSPCWVLVLVVILMTSPSSSKMDFILISCYVFYVGGFTGLTFLERLNSPLVVSSSHDGL